MKKLICFIIFIFVMSFGLGLGNAQEQHYTRTYYNNNVPYEQFVTGEYNPKNINVQVSTPKGQVVQAVVPSDIVNDEKEDLTQGEEKGQE